MILLAVTIGILVAYLVGLAFDDIEGWRWMLGLGVVPALALAFGMLRMPQSPRWLVMSGDDFAARAALVVGVARPQRRLLALWRDRPAHPGLLLGAGAGDEGQAAGGHPGDLRGARGGGPIPDPPIISADAYRRDSCGEAAGLLGRVLSA
jgi:MFS family permease